MRQTALTQFIGASTIISKYILRKTGNIRVEIGKTAHFYRCFGCGSSPNRGKKSFLCRSAVLGRRHWDVSAPELDPMAHGSSIISIFELGPRFEIQPFYSKFAGNLLS